MAPPNNLLSPDEEREVVETEAGFGAYTINDIEGEADSDVNGIISRCQSAAKVNRMKGLASSIIR
jgi:hypothetical protein